MLLLGSTEIQQPTQTQTQTTTFFFFGTLDGYIGVSIDIWGVSAEARLKEAHHRLFGLRAGRKFDNDNDNEERRQDRDRRIVPATATSSSSRIPPTKHSPP
jgi:hypothetical protein